MIAKLFKPQSVQVLTNVVTGVAALVIAWQLKKAYSAADKVVAKATEPMGQLWSDVAAWSGGYQPVEFSSAAFYLNSRYVAADGMIDPGWREIMERSNEGIAQLFYTIAPYGYLLSQYRYLIDGEVSAKTIL